MSSQSPATLMNLPGLQQLKAKVYFVKSGLMMSLQSPWNVQDSVEIGILKDSTQCYVPSLLWQQRPQQFPWLILSLAPPGCSGAGDSFCGLLLCHRGRGEHQENKPNQALQNTRPVHRYCLASAIHQPHFCVLKVCIFPSLNARRS